MPPDPVTVRRANGAPAVAALALQRMSLPHDLHVWELLKSSLSLSTAQVRTAALDLFRVRRFYDEEHPADVVFLAAWFDRDPVSAAQEMLNIPDWEDRENNIGDYDSDVEYFGARLWEELTRTDFPAALKIAAGLRGIESSGQFFSSISHCQTLTPPQAAALVKVAVKQLPPAQAVDFAVDLTRELRQRSDAKTALEWAHALPLEAGREKSLHFLESYQEAPPQEHPFAFPPLDDAELARLKALEISPERACRIPFSLLREAMAFTPEQALALLHRIPETQRRDGWLGWMLLMRAREGDAQAAGALEIPTPSPQWLHPDYTSLPLPPALTANAPEAMEALRALSAGIRNAALAAALCRAPLEAWQKWAAFARELGAPSTSLRPLLVRMASGGLASEALALAATLPEHKPETENPPPLYIDILKSWALSDFRAAAHFTALQKPGDFRSAACEGLKFALHRIPAASALEQWPDSLDTGEVESAGHYWVYLAYEDTEAGFRFFDSQPHQYAAVNFAGTAVRLDPLRAMQLVYRRPDNQLDLQNIFPRIVYFWPGRVREFLAPLGDEQLWQTVALAAARVHPDKTTAMLKGVPFTSAWDAAGSELAFTRPDLMKSIAPRMSESVRYRVMVERRRD